MLGKGVRQNWLAGACLVSGVESHPAIATPKANFVDGMQRLQGTFAKRFNQTPRPDSLACFSVGRQIRGAGGTVRSRRGLSEAAYNGVGNGVCRQTRRASNIAVSTSIVVGSKKGFFSHTFRDKHIDPRSLIPTQPEDRTVVTGHFHLFNVARPDGTPYIVSVKNHHAKIAQGQRASAVQFRRGKRDTASSRFT